MPVNGVASSPPGVRTLPLFRPGLAPSPRFHGMRGRQCGTLPATRHPQFHKVDYKPQNAAGPSYNKPCLEHPGPPPFFPASPHPSPAAPAEGRAMRLREAGGCGRASRRRRRRPRGPAPRAPPRPLREPAPSAKRRLCVRGCGRQGASPRHESSLPLPLRAGGGLSAPPPAAAVASRGRPRPAPLASRPARRLRPPAPLAHARAAASGAGSAGPPPRGPTPRLRRRPSSRAGRRGPGMRSRR